ncbi:MAG: DNA-binding NtrC family response regulator [Chlamydiales bacterium]|jgi:DNA-binding NtrC family response regulator
MASIVMADDDASGLQFARLVLEGEGHTVRTGPNGLEGLLAVEASVPDLVISDLQMPEMDGMQLLARIRQRWSDLPVIVVSVQEDVEIIVGAIRAGADNYLLKPFTPEGLISAVNKALAGSRPADAQTTSAVKSIRGRSRALVEVRHLVTLAAGCDVNLLITGETGTGKEVVSQAVHRASKLADRPFVAHNCAATPAELFESTFFGYRKGAFSGATSDRPGLLEEANGGVLFLDELSSMRMDHQAKLLRVMDNGEVRRVGDDRSRQVSVRFFAAVNRTPADLISDGDLRQDLYYRLRGIEFVLPPLRERREDLPELAEHFLPEGPTGITSAALDALHEHAWPGNVRELKNVILSAAVFAGTGRIDVEHLRLDQQHAGGDPAAAAAAAPRPARTLREIERDAILSALEACDGNRSLAAQSLGIDRSTLWRKLAAMSPEEGGPEPQS